MRKYIQWLWPNYCLLCRSITSDLAVCKDCIEELPWNKNSCHQCGLPIEGTSVSRCS
ncbi:double zinc ribbon domain-containing protein [Candidiatus Paracoxiella cheracis]|uniref:double zinc ribbon domain-containing protein n=1 Tax=Candidiatus Paracoxiella cheracis TaxID=3405120 RepID=UPI003BF5B16C